MADKRTGACSVGCADSLPTSKSRLSSNGSNTAGQKDRGAEAAMFQLGLRFSSPDAVLPIRTIFSHSRNAFRRGETETARRSQRTECSVQAALIQSDVSATSYLFD